MDVLVGILIMVQPDGGVDAIVVNYPGSLGHIHLNIKPNCKTKMTKLKDYIRFHTWENEEYVKCNSMVALKRWIEEWAGYDSIQDFETRTGVEVSTLINVWFFIVNDRIFIH